MTTTLFSPLIVEFKRGSVTAEGIFDGYASTFGGEPDAVGDIIQPGAFSDALKAHKAAGTTPALLWNHDQGSPIGTWLDLREDSKGLLVRGKLTLGTMKGREALALLKDQACSLSIGYAVSKGGASFKDGIRHISRVAKLFEISVVSIPANVRAKVFSVKQLDSARDFEKLLRDVGLSNRQAKRATAVGWKGLARDERSEFDLVLDKLDTIHCSIEEMKNEH